ncbi:hypothetical protein BZG20_12855 [Salinivibrio sp. IB868]|uniref:hypothetical protein n=1 Tax=unclassified Salinivibrio TaxID=2636825 RepID=UPI0009874866|nr:MULTISPECIES: hypothetical protein [unclassified Salinivibrio]OOE65380.1 hypothetical protein BZG20_12855 [Salinivibrio sp. IB868]OOE77443.1 hypothetical protein BZG22_03055 [Salinivibrio sp. IB870]
MNDRSRALLAIFALMFSWSSIAQSLPEGAIQEGSLANQKLIQDAMAGVLVTVASQGCEKPEEFVAYVREMPSGEVGTRVWRELWIVEGCDDTYPIKLRFQEAGAGAANWTIE